MQNMMHFQYLAIFSNRENQSLIDMDLIRKRGTLSARRGEAILVVVVKERRS